MEWKMEMKAIQNSGSITASQSLNFWVSEVQSLSKEIRDKTCNDVKGIAKNHVKIVNGKSKYDGKAIMKHLCARLNNNIGHARVAMSIYLTLAANRRDDRQEAQEIFHQVFFEDLLAEGDASEDAITGQWIGDFLLCFTLSLAGLYEVVDLLITDQNSKDNKLSSRSLTMQGVTPPLTEGFPYLTPPWAQSPQGSGINAIESSKPRIKVDKRLRNMFYLARLDIPLLIVGATGVSKGKLAPELHKMSKRRKKKYLEIDLSAIPDNLIESELFGYEKGSFTGADQKKEGLLEIADGGTIFLDELGKMPRHLQSRLLKAVEEKRIRRVGGNDLIPIDVRFIAAVQPVEIKNILIDLLNRLNYRSAIVLPTLKERLSLHPEIVISASLERACHDMECDLFIISKMAKRRIVDHGDYPGNFRDLEGILRNAILSAMSRNDKEIKPEDIQFDAEYIAVNHGNTISNIKLKDIVDYADTEANKLRASIIEAKEREIVDSGRTLNSVLREEGITGKTYNTFIKKLRERKEKGKV
jgi:DNA-binding NtrC family response regulator